MVSYNNTGFLGENSIGTWTGNRLQQTYQLFCPSGTANAKCGKTYTNYAVDQPLAVFGSVDQAPNRGVRILGSIAYLTAPARSPVTPWFVAADGTQYRDVVGRLDTTAHSAIRTIAVGRSSPVLTGSLVNATSIGGNGILLSGGSTSSNTEQVATVSQADSIYTGSKGAQICKRYKDGTLTNEPLWPWPMNQRIIDAMIQAGMQPVNVTQTIEQLFGPIPNECRVDSPNTLDQPANLRIVEVR